MASELINESKQKVWTSRSVACGRLSMSAPAGVVASVATKCAILQVTRHLITDTAEIRGTWHCPHGDQSPVPRRYFLPLSSRQ